MPGVLVDLSLELGDLLLHAGADLREPVGVELQPDPLHLRQHLDQRHLDLVQQLLDPELDQARALALGELAGEPRVDRRIAGGVALIRGEAQLPLLGPGRRRGEACVSGELVQLVRSPGGVDQVGGHHRVVGEVQALGPRRREQAARAVAAQLLDVVADERVGPQIGRERGEVRRVARDDLRAVAARPAPAADRDRDRPVGEVSGAPLLSIDLDRLLDHPAGDDLVPLLVEPLDHGSKLELVRRVAEL